MNAWRGSSVNAPRIAELRFGRGLFAPRRTDIDAHRGRLLKQKADDDEGDGLRMPHSGAHSRRRQPMFLLRSSSRTGQPLSRECLMIRDVAIGNRNFRGNCITANLKTCGNLEKARGMANRADTRTTPL
jgi:hypothetical protein